MSAQKPSTNRIIDYWPSWSDNWTRDSLKDYQKGGKKERVDIINISFAIPKGDGSLTWTDDMNSDVTKKIIKDLQAQGKKITIAVGGATGNSWNLSNPQAIKTLAVNTKKFVDEFGLDGVDIDYEEDFNGRNDAKHAKVAEYIVELRKLMPQNKYLLTAAVGSTAAYGPKNPGHGHKEWSGSQIYGLEVDLLKKTGHLLDWVNVMSYDVFDPNVKPNYSPIEAMEAYKSLMGSADKVVLGIEVGPHAWPANVRTSTVDVKPWLEHAAKNGFGGAMFWTLDFDKPNKTNEPEGAFLALASKIMPKLAGVKQGAAVDKTSKGYDDKTSKAYESETTDQYVQAPGGPGSKQGVDANKKVTGSQPQVQNLKFTPAAQNVQPAKKQGTSADTTKKDASQKAANSKAQAPAPSVTFSADSSKTASNKNVVDYHPTNVSGQNKDVIKLGIQDLTPASVAKILKLQEKQERELGGLIESQRKMKEARDAILKQATPDQVETLKGQYKEHDKQLTDNIVSNKQHFTLQLEHVIGQLRDEEKRANTYKPSKS